MSTHSEIPEDVAALITAHALGALEPDQAELAERHIAASDDCRRAYEDALETSAALALAVTDSEPPADLRERIVAAARAERRRGRAGAARSVAPRRRSRLAGLLTPSSGFAVARRRGSHRVRAGRRLAARLRHRAPAIASRRSSALIAAPDARVVPIAASGGGEAGGRVVVANGRAALMSSLARHRPPGAPTRPGACPPAAASLCRCRRSRARARGHRARRGQLRAAGSSRSSRAAARQAPSSAPIAAARL